MRTLPSILDLGLCKIHIKMMTKAQMRAEMDDIDEDETTPEGLWDVDTDTIFVGRWLSAKRKREVLFHELLHALIDYREAVGDTYETHQ